MKHILRYLLWLYLSIEVANAQTNIQSVIAIFAEKPSVEWAPPIPNSSSMLVQWQARTTSKEFRSFVGYYQDHFVGVISFDKQQLSGEVFYRGNSYVLGTSPQGMLTVEAVTDEHDCGASSLRKQALSARNFFPESDEDKNDPPIEQPEIYNSLYPKALIHTDGVFRHYRLAIPVDYSYYNSKRFNREINKIKTFWYATITFLNELYRNDIGVDFTLVDDEALIITTPEKEMFRRGTPANDVVNKGTITFNERYDKNKYDIAVIITDYRENYNGLAAVYAAYEQHQKANAAARPIKPSTIAHEIGHMFGADHTFSNGGQYSSKTETGSGQSIMSYGHEHPRDFFSLISLQEIRKFLGNSMAYYADEARTQEAGKRVEGTGSNLVYGVKSNNRPPVLDRTHIKKIYTIPEETYFQFYLNATDPEGDALTYIAHPADRRFHSTKSNARFITYKGRAERNIRFETTWFESERNTFVPIGAADSYKEGTFTFWLAAADHNKDNSNHVVKYDVEEVQVKIVKGKPFEIQNFDNGSWEQN
ncbi:MAG: reprolysin-like metallopeptidase, partial [Capnocytophaga ochracea]